jgi:hypothetical protein
MQACSRTRSGFQARIPLPNFVGDRHCKSSLDKAYVEEQGIRRFAVPKPIQRLKEEMDSYPSRCPIEVVNLYRTLNQSTGIVPDAARRAGLNRA